MNKVEEQLLKHNDLSDVSDTMKVDAHREGDAFISSMFDRISDSLLHLFRESQKLIMDGNGFMATQMDIESLGM